MLQNLFNIELANKNIFLPDTGYFAQNVSTVKSLILNSDSHNTTGRHQSSIAHLHTFMHQPRMFPFPVIEKNETLQSVSILQDALDKVFMAKMMLKLADLGESAFEMLRNNR